MSKYSEAINGTVSSLFDGMNTFLSTKSVVGEPVYVGDTTIIPLINVSFGMGAGSFAGDKKDTGGGGIGGKMSPNAVLVISEGKTRVIDIATNTGMNKLLDMVPDFVSNFMDKGKTSSNGKAREAASEILEETVMDAGQL